MEPGVLAVLGGVGGLLLLLFSIGCYDTRKIWKKMFQCKRRETIQVQNPLYNPQKKQWKVRNLQEKKAVL